MARSKLQILQELHSVFRNAELQTAEFKKVMEYIEMGIITSEEAGDMIAREYTDEEILKEVEALMEALR